MNNTTSLQVQRLLTALSLAFTPAAVASDWGAPEQIGSIEANSLDELSGLTASGHSEGLLWALNDSPDPILFAIDESGADLARFTVKGVDNNDWEGLASAPCPDIQPGCACLWIADSGEASGERELGAVVIVEEPNVEAFGGSAGDATVIWYELEGGFGDVEAMVVDPVTLDVFLFEKSASTASVWVLEGPHLPAAEDDPATASFVGPIDLPSAIDGAITDATLSPDASELVLRTDSELFIFEGGEGVLELIEMEPTSLQTVIGDGGEGVTFSHDATALLLSGEGRGAAIHSMEASDREPSSRTTSECLPPEGCACSSSDSRGASLGLFALAALAITRRRRPQN